MIRVRIFVCLTEIRVLLIEGVKSMLKCPLPLASDITMECKYMPFNFVYVVLTRVEENIELIITKSPKFYG